MGFKWEEKPLGELVAYMARGITPKYVEEYADSGVPVLGQRCVRNQMLDLTQVRFHNAVIKPVKPEKLVAPYDILINATGVGSAGRVAQALNAIPAGCTTDSHVLTLRTETIDPLYLGYFVKSQQRAIERMAEGSTGQTELNKARLSSEIIVTYPVDLVQQRAIANMFLAIDEKIDLNNRLNDYLLQLATALFEDALKSECREMLFGDIVELEDSKRIPLNSRDRERKRGPYPYYGATSIMDYVDDYLFDDTRILLGEDGSVVTDDGYPVLQYVWGKYWVNNHAHILKSRTDYSLEMLYIALSRTAILHIVTGAVQKKISQKNLNALMLEMPNPDQVQGIAELFGLYRMNVDQNKQLKQLRNTLLPKLMSGEIDVPKVDITQLNNHLGDC